MNTEELNKKKEEIRESLNYHLLCIGHTLKEAELIGLLRFFSDVGCVLKVDRELPLIDTWYDKIDDKDWTRELIYQDGQIKGRNDKAGYTAIEPLIEE